LRHLASAGDPRVSLRLGLEHNLGAHPRSHDRPEPSALGVDEDEERGGRGLGENSQRPEQGRVGHDERILEGHPHG
jgi:hypothetical protein